MLLMHVLADPCSCLVRSLTLASYIAPKSFSLPAGGSREPEALQPTFNALAAMMKHLARHLTAQVPAVLLQTARLRYASAKHVRSLAAKAVGFLLR